MGTHFGTTLLRYVQYSIFQQNVKKSTPRVMARERGDKDVLA
jgi:hypothetical protein